MAAFTIDLAVLFGSIAVQGSTMFIGGKSSIPDVDTVILSIIGYGGSGPDYIHNSVLPAYLMPTAQVTVRAKKYVDAETLARSAWNLAAAVRNQTVNGTFYQRIVPQQSEPFDGGPDERGRPTVKFNVLGTRG